MVVVAKGSVWQMMLGRQGLRVASNFKRLGIRTARAGQYDYNYPY